MTMRARQLTLQNAFQLAHLLSKYKITIDQEQDAVDFIADLISKISPEDYLLGVKFLTGLEEEVIKKYASIVILTVFIEGMRDNKVVTLFSFYESMVEK